mmetsp:Transcript_106323/g.282907  ORF Transcript_106323/g.282907 Transcript_106323/m.282907 type:complete len:82 (+) Transcript_106323:104-349(+)
MASVRALALTFLLLVAGAQGVIFPKRLHKAEALKEDTTDEHSLLQETVQMEHGAPPPVICDKPDCVKPTVAETAASEHEEI